MALAEQLVSFLAPTSVEADQYRALRHVVERTRRDAGAQVLAVTSPGSGDGKTVTVLNLAGSLAQSPDARVLVIDADLHRPSVGKYLGIDESEHPALVDAIRSERYGLSDTVRHLPRLNVTVLLPGVYQGGAYELLNSPRFEALLQEARRQFDYVLIDTPPLVPLPDCRLIAQWVDGVIVLVAAHRTPRKALGEALRLIEPSRIVGLVFNGDDRPLAPYSTYYGYHSYYGSRDGRAAGAAREFSWWRRTVSARRSGTPPASK